MIFRLSLFLPPPKNTILSDGRGESAASTSWTKVSTSVRTGRSGFLLQQRLCLRADKRHLPIALLLPLLFAPLPPPNAATPCVILRSMLRRIVRDSPPDCRRFTTPVTNVPTEKPRFNHSTLRRSVSTQKSTRKGAFFVNGVQKRWICVFNRGFVLTYLLIQNHMPNRRAMCKVLICLV